MNVRFQWDDRSTSMRAPFNGEYLEYVERVPNIGEYVCWDKVNQYKVVKVVTQLIGWKTYYTVILKLHKDYSLGL